MGQITYEVAHSLLRVCFTQGKLWWKPRTHEFSKRPVSWNANFADKEAFTQLTKDGYLASTILGKKYFAHRIIWLMYHGQMPDMQIDHVNGIKTDNRICNLRHVSNQENAKNASLSKRNTSGYTGVSFVKKTGKWLASIKSDGKNIYIGTFDTKLQAVDARKQAEIKYNYHQNHGKFLKPVHDGALLFYNAMLSCDTHGTKI